MNLSYQWHTDGLARWGIKVISGPYGEQLTLAEVAEHLNIDQYGSPAEYPQEAWLTAAISVARDLCEGLTGLSLAPQTLEIGLGGFPTSCDAYEQRGISLRMAPVIAVQTITYTDVTGTVLTMDPLLYGLDNSPSPATVYPAYNLSWPTDVAQIPNAVKIRFDAGYALPGDSPSDPQLPKSIYAAMLLVIGHLYENREATSRGDAGSTLPNELPMGVHALLERYRVRMSMA